MVCGVVLTYVSSSGLRATAWVNTFQTLVFMVVGRRQPSSSSFESWVGLSQAMALVAESHPELLIRGELISPIKLLTYTCIPLSVGMFPHMFMHWLSARRAESFRYPLVFYPVCIAAVWVPSVLLGIMGRIDFPELKGAAANSVLVKMIGLYAPELLAGLLGAGILAAVMSSLDSQFLALGSMFTEDIVKHYRFHDRMTEKQQVLAGRLFVIGIVLLIYVFSLLAQRSIFKLGVWSFTGFASLFPVVAAALFWKRSTKYGAFGSVISVVVLWSYFFMRGWESPGYTVGGTGVMAVAIILPVSALVMVVVSLLTRPPERSIIAKFFPK